MTGLECRTDGRPSLLRDRGINGIDTVEVEGDGRALRVYFLTGVPYGLRPANVRIDGTGPRSRAVSVDPVPVDSSGGDEPDAVTVRLDRVGGPGTYRLSLVEADAHGRPTRTPLEGLDPRSASASFAFTQICASDLDCAAPAPCLSAPLDRAARDYLARDYPTFRRLLLDRMALVAPGWQERRVPDLGVTLVELLAYVADHLAYYQDAVATEAYLDTARQRISVRRHGRLVDHVLGEGTNARAFVVVGVDTLITLDVDDLGFVTGWPDAPPVGRAVGWDVVDALRPGTVEEFRPLLPAGVSTLTFRPGNDAIAIHTWGGAQCHLAAGTTAATLVDAAADGLGLDAGDLLVLEEVRGRDTGLPADADPSRRHVVRLIGVDEGYDAATETSVLEVRWALADALPFPLCLSTLGPAPDCAPISGVAVACANVVPVDHGRWVREVLPVVPLASDGLTCAGPCRPADVTPRAGRFRPRLTLPDLTHAEPLPSGETAAAALLARDPAAALPALDLREGDDGPRWTVVPDLMGSGPADRHVVVEMDDERVAHLRMGDDRLGEEPEPGTVFEARYRVGNGRAGNVGAEAISYLVSSARGDAVRVRNPVPAAGGADPESIAEARLLIPASVRAVRERAVTADDYAELAVRIGGATLQSAAADLVWTGVGYVADVALDPRVTGLPADPADLARRVAAALRRQRRVGHDVRVVAAALVPVDLQVTVCVAAGVVAAHVKAQLEDLLGARGWFHPDRWTFGQSVDVSPIVAAAAGVSGVTAAEVTRLAKADTPGTDVAGGVNSLAGVLRIGRHEIAVLDPGPDRALGGRLEIVTTGGR